MTSFQLRPRILRGLIALAVLLAGLRATTALASLSRGDESGFLAFPLTVILPLLAFAFLARPRPMHSSEGALMQLGCMIQILLIIALPGFALYLALGFPVVFLVIELFETRFPTRLRNAIKRQVIT